MARQVKRLSPVNIYEITAAVDSERLGGLGWRAWKAGRVSGRSCIRKVLVKAVRFAVISVSYTHLTLPTNREV